MQKWQIRLEEIQSVGPGGLPRSGKNLTEDQVLESLSGTLDGTELCALSTVNPKGTADSAHVYFAYSAGLDLYFLSDPGSIHCSNLRTNASMAISVYDSTQHNFSESGDRGLALHGECHEAENSEASIAEEIYGVRFPPYTSWRMGPDFDHEARKWRFFHFVTMRIKAFDEPRFGSSVFVLASVRR